MYENEIYSNSYGNSNSNNGINNFDSDPGNNRDNSTGSSGIVNDSINGNNGIGNDGSIGNSGIRNDSSIGNRNIRNDGNIGNNGIRNDSGMGNISMRNDGNIGNNGIRNDSGIGNNGIRNDSTTGNSTRNNYGAASPYFDYTAYPTSSTVFMTETKKKEKKPKKPLTGVAKVALSAGLGLCFGLFAGAGFYGVKIGTDHFLQTDSMNNQTPQVQTPAFNEVINSEDLINAMMGNNAILSPSRLTYVTSDVSEVVEDVMPAMVTILNTYTVTSTSIWGQVYSEPRQGGGSGIIVAENDSELLIVTNNHVVESADDLQVTFSDGSTAKASIKGLDADMDLGVIAVNLKDISSETRSAITIATLGDSENLKLGEPVIAIGNALGYGQSVTTGIVSALNREMTMEDGSIGVFVQTDAAINEGNSGGALLNIKGEVIGINSSKIGGSKVDNVGFAIPISSASPIIAELMERKTRVKVADSEKGYLGIEMLQQEVPESVLALYGIPQGVYINNVQEGCAAEKAGIIQRDIVVKIDGTKVTTRAELQKEMEYHAAGETIIVTIERLENGKYVTYDIEVTLGKKPRE